MPIVARPVGDDELEAWVGLASPAQRAMEREDPRRQVLDLPADERRGCLLLWEDSRPVARVRLTRDARAAYLLWFTVGEGCEASAPAALRAAMEVALAGRPAELFAAYAEPYAPLFAAAGFRERRRRTAMVAPSAARPVAWPLTLAGVTPPGAPVSVRLERPSREDVVALGTLIYRAYRGGVDDNGEIEADGIAEARGYFETPGVLALRPELSGLARVGDALLGACLITRWQGWMLVAHLVVDPAWQGRGLGRALLQSSLADLAAHGVQEALLYVTRGNPAQRLYRALGFREVPPDHVNGVLAASA